MTIVIVVWMFATIAVWVLSLIAAVDWHRMKRQRNAYNREAQEWAKLYWDLRDDTPARGSDGKFTRRHGRDWPSKR